MKRREFLQAVTAAGVPLAADRLVGGQSAGAKPDSGNRQEKSRGEVPYRPLGRTGVHVSMIGLGGYHIGMQNNERDSIRIIHTAMIMASTSWTIAGIITTAERDPHGQGAQRRLPR